MPNRLDPDQVPTFAGPDLGPGCFKQLSTDDTSRQKFENVWKNTGQWSVEPKFGFRSSGMHVWMCVRWGGGVDQGRG